MTKSELIEILENIPGDPEIYLAQQPNWPFKYDISSVELVLNKQKVVDLIKENQEPLLKHYHDTYPGNTSVVYVTLDEDDENTIMYCNEDGEVVTYKDLEFISKIIDIEELESEIYIAEGEQLGYLPGNAKEKLGW